MCADTDTHSSPLPHSQAGATETKIALVLKKTIAVEWLKPNKQTHENTLFGTVATGEKRPQDRTKFSSEYITGNWEFRATEQGGDH